MYDAHLKRIPKRRRVSYYILLLLYHDDINYNAVACLAGEDTRHDNIVVVVRCLQYSRCRRRREYRSGAVPPILFSATDSREYARVPHGSSFYGRNDEYGVI